MHKPAEGDFARIRDLLAAAGDAHKRGSLARGFDAAVVAEVMSRARLEAGEADLGGVDGTAWPALKAEAAARLGRFGARRWEALFDLLNEVKGYIHLKSLGCTEIGFVARSYAGKSPDLRAVLDGRVVLCEVKTITVAAGPLSEEFLTGKLAWTMAAAKAQLAGLGPVAARRIVCLVLRAEVPAASRARIEAQGAAAGVEVAILCGAAPA